MEFYLLFFYIAEQVKTGRGHCVMHVAPLKKKRAMWAHHILILTLIHILFYCLKETHMHNRKKLFFPCWSQRPQIIMLSDLNKNIILLIFYFYWYIQ